MRGNKAGASSRLPLLLMGGVAAGLLAYSCLRAIRVPVAHDEALNYFYVFRHGLARILTFAYASASNHILNSLLTRLAVVCFGASAFVLRLPNLLAHVLYLGASLFLMRRLRHPAVQVAGFLLLNLNPFLLDYFSMSRGYGLASAFTLLSVCFAAELFARDPGDDRLASRALWSAWLAVVANFAFLNYYLALAGVVFLARLLHWNVQTRPPPRISSLLPLCRFAGRGNLVLWRNAAFLALAVGSPLIQVVHIGDLYYGGTTGLVHDTVGSLVALSFYDVPAPPATLAAVGWAAVGVFGACVALTLAALKRDDPQTADPALRVLLGLEALIALAAAGLWLQHALLGVKYPLERTALYLLVLFLCLAVFAADRLLDGLPAGRARFGAAVLMLFVCVEPLALWCGSLNLTHAVQSRFSADVPAMLQTLDRDYRASPAAGRSVTLGAHWTLSPCINYYIATRGLDWLEPIQRRGLDQEYDYYYCRPADVPEMAGRPVEVIGRFPLTGSVLYRRRPPSPPPPAP